MQIYNNQGRKKEWEQNLTNVRIVVDHQQAQYLIRFIYMSVRNVADIIVAIAEEIGAPIVLLKIRGRLAMLKDNK